MGKKGESENFVSFCLGGTSKLGNDLAQPTRLRYDSTGHLHVHSLRPGPGSSRG